MGKAYDGKKRWNETVLQTTDAASGSASAGTKKRYSGRTVKLSKAMRSVDDETRAVVRNARLDALEADNYGEDDAWGGGDGDAADGDDLYVDDDEDAGQKKSKTAKQGKAKATRTASSAPKRRWKVKSLAQLVYEELGTGERAATPNYLSVAAAPSKAHAARKFCVVCGFFAAYQCRRCGSRFCRVKCGEAHQESGCMKFGL